MADSLSGLNARLLSLGLPVVSVFAGPPPVAQLSAAATQAQRDQAAAVCAGWAGARVRRTLLAIRNDLAALNATQQANVWANLLAGNPPLWKTDAGPNMIGLAAIAATGAPSLEAKLWAVAGYVQDNNSYLVNPAFDPSILVYGDAPAP